MVKTLRELLALAELGTAISDEALDLDVHRRRFDVTFIRSPVTDFQTLAKGHRPVR